MTSLHNSFPEICCSGPYVGQSVTHTHQHIRYIQCISGWVCGLPGCVCVCVCVRVCVRVRVYVSGHKQMLFLPS